MHKFRCPDGHEFEAERNFRAHCPTCGKSATRIYDAKDDSQVKEPEKPSEQESERKEDGENKPPPEAPPKPPDRPTNTVRRVQVKRGGSQAKKEDVKTDKDKSSAGTPAKKVKVRKGAAPKVNKKIVTTRDRKMNKEKNEERATQWNRVRSFKIF